MQTNSTSETELQEKVQEAYSNAADSPEDSLRFPSDSVSHQVWVTQLNYCEAFLKRLWTVSPVFPTCLSTPRVPAGTIVLDLACGAGTDPLITAGKTGPTGRIHGVDFSLSMLSHARAGAATADIENAKFREAEGQSIPFSDGTFDVVLVNGIFNLNRHDIFEELARVIWPGGVVYCGEIVLNESMDDEGRAGLSNWFS